MKLEELTSKPRDLDDQSNLTMEEIYSQILEAYNNFDPSTNISYYRDDDNLPSMSNKQAKKLRDDGYTVFRNSVCNVV